MASCVGMTYWHSGKIYKYAASKLNKEVVPGHFSCGAKNGHKLHFKLDIAPTNSPGCAAILSMYTSLYSGTCSKCNGKKSKVFVYEFPVGTKTPFYAAAVLDRKDEEVTVSSYRSFTDTDASSNSVGDNFDDLELAQNVAFNVITMSGAASKKDSEASVSNTSPNIISLHWQVAQTSSILSDQIRDAKAAKAMLADPSVPLFNLIHHTKSSIARRSSSNLVATLLKRSQSALLQLETGSLSLISKFMRQAFAIAQARVSTLNIPSRLESTIFAFMDRSQKTFDRPQEHLKGLPAKRSKITLYETLLRDCFAGLNESIHLEGQSNRDEDKDVNESTDKNLLHSTSQTRKLAYASWLLGAIASWISSKVLKSGKTPSESLLSEKFARHILLIFFCSSNISILVDWLSSIPAKHKRPFLCNFAALIRRCTDIVIEVPRLFYSSVDEYHIRDVQDLRFRLPRAITKLRTVIERQLQLSMDREEEHTIKTQYLQTLVELSISFHDFTQNIDVRVREAESSEDSVMQNNLDAQSAPLVLLKNDHLPWSTDNEDAKSVNMDQTMSTLAQMPLLEGGFYVWDIILDEGDYNSIEGDGSGGLSLAIGIEQSQFMCGVKSDTDDMFFSSIAEHLPTKTQNDSLWRCTLRQGVARRTSADFSARHKDDKMGSQRGDVWAGTIVEGNEDKRSYLKVVSYQGGGYFPFDNGADTEKFF
jgi:hypothetical protein